MKLYYSPGVCSLAPHIAMREIGIDPVLMNVNLANHELVGGSDYRKINPRGYVPILELEDGNRISECAAILQYLADLRPEAKLAPPNGTWARSQLQEWLGFISSELHKGFGPVFDPGLSDDAKKYLVAKLEKRLNWTEEQMKGSSWLTGEGFTVADAYLFTVVGWLPYAQMDKAKWPRLQALCDRVAARPAVQAALRAEGLIK